MTHSNITPNRDPAALALIHSEQLSEAFFKAMAIVCVDGRPFDLVTCDTTLYMSLCAAFDIATDPQEPVYASIVWMPCGHPGGEVSTLYWPRAMWDAMCPDEDRMQETFRIMGIYEYDDEVANAG